MARGVALFSSSLYPETDREQQIPIWPPTKPLNLWFERVWFAPFERWDTRSFEKIVVQGYSVDDGTAQFHPLFPWLARLFTMLGVSGLVSLSAVSLMSGTVLAVVLYIWSSLELAPRNGEKEFVLFLTSPFAFVLHLPYSESLFLLMTSLCFVLIRKRRWMWAGAAGALATLTRQQGLLLVVPLVIGLIKTYGCHLSEVRKSWKRWSAPIMIPLAYGGWIAYRAWVLRDLSPDFTSFVRFIYSVLISPSATKVVPEQTFMWPWQALIFALKKTVRSPDLDMMINFGLSALFLIFTLVAWRKMRLESKVFTIMIIVLSFGYSTGPVHPYMGLPRHLLLAIPVFVAFGKVINSFGGRLALMVSGVIGQMFIIMVFVLHVWVP